MRLRVVGLRSEGSHVIIINLLPPEDKKITAFQNKITLEAPRGRWIYS